MRIQLNHLCLATFLLGSSVFAAEDADLEFFEKKIRPVLVAHCYECHSAESRIVSGELLLDSRDGIRKGGESGSALESESPDASLLIKAVRYTDDAVKMPPKGKLPDSVIADLEEWVRRGAPDPREQPVAKVESATWAELMQQRSDWWSLRPVASVEIPSTPDVDPASSPIDRFLRAKLSDKGLQPAGSTDPRTLIRRLSLVLTGLPPTADQIDQFVADCRTGTAIEPLPVAAVERLVDTLLRSPHFGEHWARHWLDVVRFSETHGNEWNYEVHHAWRYRDYLIRAFNEDVPYDQFIREHIAGDLLSEPRWNQRDQFNESVIGTGFYRFGEVNHDDCITLRSIGYDLADNQIDTLTKAFQATTVACARCHNHKLDAISTEDYYAMLAILRSSRNVSHCIDAPEVNSALRQRLTELKAELRRETGRLWREEANLFARYLLAAHAVRANQPDAVVLATGLDAQQLEKWVAALAAEKQPLEEPLEVWRRIAAVEIPAAEGATNPNDAEQQKVTLEKKWTTLRDEFLRERHARHEFNATQFVTFADFSQPIPPGWMTGGQSMTAGASRHGDFVVQADGDRPLQSILPAGRFTHALSAKLNGTLRSPVIPAGKRYISFQVMGQRSSAVRLVSNHCQLNYANYRALTTPDFVWVTFSPPDEREGLRTYAELMTMFDNPKFPDQLSPLGGDTENYKLPWEKAAENPRSYFGITRVVLHDSPETPKPSLNHLQSLFAEHEQSATDSQPISNDSISLTELAERYAQRMTSAVDAWILDQASEDDVAWLDSMLRRDLLRNKLGTSSAVDRLIAEYRFVEGELALPRVAVGVSDGGPGIEQPVFIRGDCNRPSNPVPRRYLEVLSRVEHSPTALEPFKSTGSGRLELANLIASPENPLTARVMVNRVWHHVFGIGIVRTVDDFGHVGELPTHPELLDYLAGRFVEQGWSVKQLIRSLVLTRAFQQSSRPSARAREIDPQNRLLQHYSARRMDAESVRDSILFASGSLDRTLFGPSIQPYREKEYADRRLFPGPLDGLGRRSVYIKNNLMEGPKFLETFNFPGGKVTQGRRDVTNVPAQALALLNDPFVIQQAEIWSKQVLAASGDSFATRLDKMFQTALGRSPDAEELSRFEKTAQELATLYQVPAEKIMDSQEIWKDMAHALFNLNEMIYIP